MSLRTRQNESVTFRIEASLKADLNRLAAKNHQTLGSFIRDIAEQRIKEERRRVFENEAERQSRAAAAAAREADSDEQAVLQELERDLDAFDDEWK